MSRSRKIWVFSLLFFVLLCCSARAYGAWPQPDAAAFAVLEAESGTLLFSKNGDQPLPPASTCKIATALLTLKLSDDLERPVTVSPAAAAVGESSIDLKAGEELTLADLLRGALVHSGNDACFALAEAVAGSEPLFVHWLNVQALLLGAYSARFRNTNGLPVAGHAISAHDLVRLTAQAMEEPFFAETVGSKYAELGKGENYRFYRNTNRLLWQDERIVGVKTGTTDEAGPCLVAALRQDSALYISVVFHSADRYGASLQLLNYAADHYRPLSLVRAGEPVACLDGELLYAVDKIDLILPRNDTTKLRLRWQLPRRLQVLDGAGREVAATALLTADAAAGTAPTAPNYLPF